MAVIDFPESPIDGQEYTQNDSTWVYSTAKGTWEATTTDLSTEGVVLKAYREDMYISAVYEVDFRNGNYQTVTMTVAGTITIIGTDPDVVSPLTLEIIDGDQYEPSFGSEFTWRDGELVYWPEVPRGLLEILTRDAAEYLVSFAGVY